MSLLDRHFPSFQTDLLSIRGYAGSLTQPTDSDFIIDYVRNISSSVVLLSSDSGHAVPHSPRMGQGLSRI